MKHELDGLQERAGHVMVNRHKNMQVREELTRAEREVHMKAINDGLDSDIVYALINKGQSGSHKVVMWGVSPDEVQQKARKFYVRSDDDFFWEHSEIIPVILTMRHR